MFPHRRLVVLFACALLACGPRAASAQTPEQWQALQLAAADKSDQIMAEANRHKGPLAQYQVMRRAYEQDKSPAFRMIFGQYISWHQSFIGDYPDAAASFSIRQVSAPDDSPSPLGLPGYHAHPALATIPELAKSYPIVLLNEAHNVALTRSLTVQLLGRLRAEGFDYFAAETLYQTDTGLQARGYPVDKSGFYTEEPVCAEMVRTALKLGFKVVAYEAQSAPSGDAREAGQARNLYNAVFKRDPKARLVVDAGYSHIVKTGRHLGGSSMAEYLYKLTGLPMLSVEQTMLYPHAIAGNDHPIYAAVMEQLHPDVPIVFTSSAGKPWSLRPGYDVSVFFPPTHLVHGRPDWLSLGGLREPWFVDGARCQQHFPCLVEARYADESDDAIPADRMVLDQLPQVGTLDTRVMTNSQGVPGSDLYLRPGKYRLRFSAENGDPLYHRNITVPAKQLHELVDTTRKATDEQHRLLDQHAFALADDPSHPLAPPARDSDMPAIDLAPLDQAAQKLKQSAQAYEAAYHARAASGLDLTDAQRNALNTLMGRMEQSLTSPDGLPGRTWFRHMIYAPGMLTGYGVKTVPGVREALEARRWDEADRYAVVTAKVLDGYRAQLDRLTGMLKQPH